jgi:hypothetical protein
LPPKPQHRHGRSGSPVSRRFGARAGFSTASPTFTFRYMHGEKSQSPPSGGRLCEAPLFVRRTSSGVHCLPIIPCSCTSQATQWLEPSSLANVRLGTSAKKGW